VFTDVYGISALYTKAGALLAVPGGRGQVIGQFGNHSHHDSSRGQFVVSGDSSLGATRYAPSTALGQRAPPGQMKRSGLLPLGRASPQASQSRLKSLLSCPSSKPIKTLLSWVRHTQTGIIEQRLWPRAWSMSISRGHEARITHPRRAHGRRPGECRLQQGRSRSYTTVSPCPSGPSSSIPFRPLPHRKMRVGSPVATATHTGQTVN
jgi:hypothetical protein